MNRFRRESDQFLDLGIAGDTTGIDPHQLARGIKVEYEHGKSPALDGDPRTDVTGDDPTLTAKIALRHLRERPDYYDGLAAYEYSPPGWFSFWGANDRRAKMYWVVKQVAAAAMIVAMIMIIYQMGSGLTGVAVMRVDAASSTTLTGDPGNIYIVPAGVLAAAIATLYVLW